MRVVTDDPLKTQSEMLASGLNGVIVLKGEMLKKVKKLELKMPFAFLIDLVNMSEKEIEQISLSAYPVVIPIFDNLFETGQVSAKYGCSPASFIENMGLLDRDCTLVGGMYADKDDLEILGAYSPKMVICPRGYARKGAIMPNILLMQKYGLRLELGSLGEKVDFEKEIEFLYLSTLSMLENAEAASEDQIKKIALGEEK